METTKKLSVIIPVYNGEKYLRKCLDSIVNQKPSNLEQVEVIVILDLSTDKSEEIIKEYVEKYPKLITFIKVDKRHGANGCRYKGLQQAKGEYIEFLDADDFLLPNSFDTVFSTIDETHADLINFNYKYLMFTIHPINCVFFNKHSRYVNNAEFLALIIQDRIVRGYLWNKIYKRELFNEDILYYGEATTLCEDLSLNLSLGIRAKKIYLSNKMINVYNKKNNQSLTKVPRHDRCIQNIICYKSMKEFIAKTNDKTLIDVFNKNHHCLYKNLFYIMVFDFLFGAKPKYCRYIMEQGRFICTDIKI